MGAEDCIKNEVQWRHGFQLIQPKELPKPRILRKKRNPRVKKMGNIPALTEVGKTTRVEQKSLRREQKQTLKRFEVSSSEDSDEETKGELDLPSAFKSYTIQDQKIILQDQSVRYP